MEFIVWNNELSVGVQMFDEDHKKLIDYINKLHLGMKSGEGIAGMTFILDGLIDYTITHFSREEVWMRSHEYPDYPSHHEAHAALTKQVLDFQKQLKEGRSAFTLELMVFLRDWLTGHIMTVDKKLGNYILAQGA